MGVDAKPGPGPSQPPGDWLWQHLEASIFLLFKIKRLYEFKATSSYLNGSEGESWVWGNSSRDKQIQAVRRDKDGDGERGERVRASKTIWKHGTSWQKVRFSSSPWICEKRCTNKHLLLKCPRLVFSVFFLFGNKSIHITLIKQSSCFHF